jgi:SPP1 family predicted phage head-tail adaptor
MNAGSRNKHLTLQKLTESTTVGGEVTETAVDTAKVWAAIEPLSSREAWQAQQSQATTTHKITMLYMPGVTSRMQAVWAGRTFRFESVVNLDEANRELMVTATEVLT